jgi:hypothetical protein
VKQTAVQQAKCMLPFVVAANHCTNGYRLVTLSDTGQISLNFTPVLILQWPCILEVEYMIPERKFFEWQLVLAT